MFFCVTLTQDLEGNGLETFALVLFFQAGIGNEAVICKNRKEHRSLCP